jgi:hypothetical protein
MKGNTMTHTDPTPGKWGNVGIGDCVSSEGRHGAGQPIVTGTVIDIQAQHVRIKQADGTVRVRTISKVRRVDDSDGPAALYGMFGGRPN